MSIISYIRGALYGALAFEISFSLWLIIKGFNQSALAKLETNGNWNHPSIQWNMYTSIITIEYGF